MHPTPQPARRRLVLVTLLALVSLGVLALTRPALGPAVWSRGDDLALAVAWLVAVVAAAWLFLATGTCVVALGLGRPRIARRLAPALPFGVRRLVELAVVAACVSLPALPAPRSVRRRSLRPESSSINRWCGVGSQPSRSSEPRRLLPHRLLPLPRP